MFPYSTLGNHNTDLRHSRLQSGGSRSAKSALGHLQGVKGAQALEGIRSYLGDLVVAQVSALKENAKLDAETSFGFKPISVLSQKDLTQQSPVT